MDVIFSVPRPRICFLPIFLCMLGMMCPLLGHAQDRPLEGPDQLKIPKLPKKNDTGTIKKQIRYVLIPVLVHGKDHQHVSGLTKEDFTVTENGKVRHVTSMEEIHSDAKQATYKKESDSPSSRDGFAAYPHEKVFTNELSDKQQKRIVIVVIDNINTARADRVDAQQRAVRFLTEHVKDDSLIEVVSFNPAGVRIIHDFTQDTGALIAALKNYKLPAAGTTEYIAPGAAEQEASMNGTPTVAPTPASGSSSFMSGQQSDLHVYVDELMYKNQMQNNAVNQTMDSFQYIAHAFAGVPGHKALIWLTSSIPFRIQTLDPFAIEYQNGGVTTTATATNQSLVALPSKDIFDMPDPQRYQGMMQQLNQSDIAVYPVDARGLVFTGLNDATSAFATRNADLSSMSEGRMQLNDLDDTHATMADFADKTGGVAFYNTNDVTAAMEKAVQDSSDYYLLSYLLSAADSKPGWHRLNVKVDRHGVDVRARKGFYYSDLAKDQKELRDQEINLGLLSPFDFTSLVVQAAFGKVKTLPDGSREVSYRIILPPESVTVDEDDSNRVNMDFAFSAHDAKGNMVDHQDLHYTMTLKEIALDKVRQHGILFDQSLKVTPGEYDVRFVVRDNLSGRTGSVRAPLRVN